MKISKFRATNDKNTRWDEILLFARYGNMTEELFLSLPRVSCNLLLSSLPLASTDIDKFIVIPSHFPTKRASREEEKRGFGPLIFVTSDCVQCAHYTTLVYLYCVSFVRSGHSRHSSR